MNSFLGRKLKRGKLCAGRFLALVLAAACLLAACGAAPARGTRLARRPGPGFAEDAFLTDFCAALQSPENLLSISLSPQENPGQRVAVDEALLADIANALYYGAVPEAAQQPVLVQDVSGPAAQSSPAPIAVPPLEQQGFVAQIEINSRGGTGLYAGLFPAQTGCVLAAGMGEQAAEYSYSAAVYRYIYNRIAQSMVPDELIFTGDVREMAPLAVPAGAITQWMDCAGGLAALSTWTPDPSSNSRVSALEILNPETGESLFYQKIGAEALRIEAAAFLTTDMRVVMADGAIWYLNSQNPAVGAYYFYLPDALRDRLLAPRPTDRPTIRHFDGGTGQGAVWALSDEQGLTWARRSAGGTIPSSVILENLPAGLYEEGDLAPQFGEVRVMNGGATLAATVVLPGSQMGNTGIVTWHIGSGEMNWYFGMFPPMLADLRFLDGQNLLVAGDEEFFRLNVTTGEAETAPAPEGLMTAATTNYDMIVFSNSTPNADGTISTSYHEGNAESGAQEEAFLTATSGAQFPLLYSGVSGKYLLLRGAGSDVVSGPLYIAARPEPAANA